ncbi:efflux transporter outer membrane subunit [Neisseriaceae bacterium TC5R-5]|nr:efflux transporter outer membrane subunit [Neisseriaceae bacterium TC5R-5]
MTTLNQPRSIHGLLLGALLLSGCAQFGPEPPPATPLSAQQLQISQQSGYQVPAQWWQQLHDPTLNALIAQTLEQSPSLQLAAARLRQARSQLGLSESQLGPQIDANATLDRERYSLYGLLPPPIGGHYYNVYSLTLNARWELDFWGKHRAEVAAALGEQQAVAIEGEQARLLLTQNVLAQYTQLQRLLAQSALLQARQQQVSTRLQLSRARNKAGLLAADELRPLQLQLNQLQQQQQNLITETEHTRHALAALSGQAPDALTQLTPAPLGAPPALNQAALTINLLGQRPDILAQRARVEAMNQSVSAAKAEFYPNISLGAFIGQSAVESSQLLKSQSQVLGISPAISLPVFYSGALQANLAGSRARYDMAVASYNQTLLDALREAADSLSDWQQSHAQLRDTHQATVLRSDSASSAQARFHAGLINRIALLDAQEAKLNQQAAQIDALARQRLAWVAVNTALGGGELPTASSAVAN